MLFSALLLAVTAQFSAPNHSVTLPAEYTSEHMPFIRVVVHGTSRPLWFVIDSGSSYTFLDQRVVKELGLKTHGSGTITGAGAGKIPVTFVEDVTFDMPGFSSAHNQVRVTDLSGLPSIIGHPIDGFFGYDLLATTVVTMNPHLSRITVTDPARFSYQGKGVVLPLRFGGKSGRWIFVPATITVAGNPPEKTEVMVDSGSADAVNHPLLRKSKKPLRKIETGNGLGNPLPGVLGEVESLQLGGYVLWHLSASCCGAAIDRLIGQGVLGQFVTTFDYQRSRLILER